MDSEAPENAALAGLLATITDRKIRRKVHKLLQHGEEAVRALGEIDVALYLREDGEEQLQIVADACLSHFRRLMEYLGMVAPSPGRAATDPGEGEFEASAAAHQSLRTRSIVAQKDKSDDDRWSSLSAEMVTLQYGLGSELKEFERRFADALKNDRKEQAVRDLNDATTGLMDGVFAVMTTVYECFLGYAEPERMVPGHRDKLGKALAIRRAIADLRREIRELNGRIQAKATPPEIAETCYLRIVDAVGNFVDSDTFAYLRSDTRRDFWQFRETFTNGDVSRNRLDCEGFDKYLDSLAFVSQRGVLIKHDTDLKAKIASDLERALKFAAVLPDVVCEVIEQAFVKAERLSGLNDQIDELVLEWSLLTPDERAEVEKAVTVGRQLFELVHTPTRAATSNEGDFF